MHYILEHLEPRLYKWCQLEYEHISKIVGNEQLIFTNIKSKSQKIKLEKLGKVEKNSVVNLGLETKKICILDPFAPKTLTSEDRKRFDYFIFGGILGDYPMRARTKEELSSKLPGAETRNIGKEQMPTDNAFYVVKEIIEHGKKLEELKFKDSPELEVKEGESIIMPFRYVLVNGKILMSKKLEYLLKTKKGF
ncbi:hypothetical protein HYT52_01775 [Candidatus Woesearchaeota archaeon]|nr:hypothetical protein [Candidatus Woesearchaeota archaeon]